MVYDTLRSSSPTGFLTSAACVETDDGSDLLATQYGTPTSGSVYYFLVRAENGCGGGTLGAESAGTLRQGRGCP